MKSFIQKNLGLLLTLVMLIIALATFKSYGVGTDENIQREIGLKSYEYAFLGNDALLNYRDRDYGVAFELPLIIIEKALKFTDTRTIFLMRHLVTHLLFLLSALFFFKLIDYLYNSKAAASIGYFMLVLNPIIYSHSFFNSKDIPFLSMFIISMYFAVKSLKDKSFKNFLFLGISTGLLINIRIMGVIIPLISIIFLAYDAIREKDYLPNLKRASLLILISALTLYVTWPFLWKNPIVNFVQAFNNMSKFRWDSAVLFGGELIKGTDISWLYIPVWFMITTPLIFIALGLSGSAQVFINFLSKQYSFMADTIKRAYLLFLISFLGPIVIVILLKSVLYDAWRQLFFIYPSFVMLALYGLYPLSNTFRKIFLGGVLFTFIMIGFFSIKNFPFQHVYFNELLLFTDPEYMRKNFELDYWAVSTKQSLEYLLANDRSERIKVDYNGGDANIMILPLDQQKRIQKVPIEDATYFITNYRTHPHAYQEFLGLSVFSIKVSGNTINEIFKLK